MNLIFWVQVKAWRLDLSSRQQNYDLRGYFIFSWVSMGNPQQFCNQISVVYYCLPISRYLLHRKCPLAAKILLALIQMFLFLFFSFLATSATTSSPSPLDSLPLLDLRLHLLFLSVWNALVPHHWMDRWCFDRNCWELIQAFQSQFMDSVDLLHLLRYYFCWYWFFDCYLGPLHRHLSWFNFAPKHAF